MIVLKETGALTSDRRELLERQLSEKIGDKVVILPMCLDPVSIGKLVVISKEEYLLSNPIGNAERFDKMACGHNFILWDGKNQYYSVEYIDKKIGE